MDFTLRKDILQTIIFYDILNFPPTSFEVWKYLIAGSEKREMGDGNCALGEIVEALESDELKKHIEEFRGFYFLRGRKDSVGQRIQNDKNSIAKFKIAQRAARWLRFVPFVRMVAVTGTLAMKNCEKDSDIDFFVVLGKGRIFTGRLLFTLAIHLLGCRRHGKKIKNRICLNYFLATGNLEIKRQDLFAANEYSFIYPLFGFDMYEKFGKSNIKWMKRYKPNFEFAGLEPAKYFVEVKPLQRKMRELFETLINFLGGDRMEAWLKKVQIRRIRQNPLTHGPGAYIEATDENLIFLPDPQGPKVLEKYRALTTKNNFL